ncbi:MAG TPA: four helix bundle protein [Puia sp.]|nr:four helix bundle protein [Puia sp.]
MQNDLIDRTFRLAVRILKMVESFPNTKIAHIIGNQIGRSGSSIASNYRAAQRARSRKEFIAKIGIAEEEADETVFWMELAIESGLLSSKKASLLLKEATEITAILTSIEKSAKNNLGKSAKVKGQATK